MNFRLHPDAALEHEDQIAYYEERRAGLGRRYHLAKPPLHFELRDVLVGVDTIAIYYRNVFRNRMVAEVLRFDDQYRVVNGAGLYGGVAQ